MFYSFCGRPPSCGGPGQLPSLPSLKSGPETQCKIDQRKSPCQLDSSSRFDTMPAGDGETDAHKTTAYTALALRHAVKTICV